MTRPRLRPAGSGGGSGRVTLRGVPGRSLSWRAGWADTLWFPALPRSFASRVQAVDTSSMTEEELKKHKEREKKRAKKARAKARKAAEKAEGGGEAEGAAEQLAGVSLESKDEGEGEGEGAAGGAGKKKKKKKKGKGGLKQTLPPTVPVARFYPDGVFPEGQVVEYKDDNLWRTTSEEKRELERLEADIYNDVRQAAEVHREVSDLDCAGRSRSSAVRSVSDFAGWHGTVWYSSQGLNPPIRTHELSWLMIVFVGLRTRLARLRRPRDRLGLRYSLAELTPYPPCASSSGAEVCKHDC